MTQSIETEQSETLSFFDYVWRKVLEEMNNKLIRWVLTDSLRNALSLSLIRPDVCSAAKGVEERNNKLKILVRLVLTDSFRNGSHLGLF